MNTTMMTASIRILSRDFPNLKDIVFTTGPIKNMSHETLAKILFDIETTLNERLQVFDFTLQ